MTTKTYQAQLPLRNHRIVTPVPLPRSPRTPSPTHLDILAGDLKRSISQVLLQGFWFCRDCDGLCEREEGEHGQPAHCSSCCSPRIEWNPPVHQALEMEVA